MDKTQGKCKINSPTMFSISTFGASCQLYYGYNTKFDYEYKGNMVNLSKPGVWLSIEKKEFNDKFTII
jgi:hypothetical protein